MVRTVLLIALLPALFLPGVAAADSVERRLAEFYAADLDHGYFLPRIHALAGLGHLEGAASETVPRIADLAEEAATVERLIALWALARIGTAEAMATAGDQAAAEMDKLLEGPATEVAARLAVLAALPGMDARRSKLDRALPTLYNAARGKDLEGRLLAAWALYQFGAPVTVGVADEAMRGAAEMLDPGHANYTRHLTYIRLVGPPAADGVAERLAQIARRHNFAPDIFSRRARTVFTLSALTSFDHPAMRDFRRRLPERLGSFLERSDALEAVLVLGPYACSPAVVAELKAITGKPDKDNRDEALRALEFCRSP